MLETFGLAGWLIAALAVILTGISKAGFGSALGGIAVPMLALFMPPKMAAAVMLPVLCLTDAFGIRAYWRRWAVHELRALVPGALIGIVAGTLAFGLLPDRWLTGLIGVIAVLFAADRLLGMRGRMQRGSPSQAAGVGWGALSGFTSTLAHAGGPPVLVFLFGRQLAKETFVATTVVYFALINAVKLLPYAALGLFTREVLLVALCLTPLVPLGVWLGLRIQRRMPERPFFIVATTLLGCSGLKLLWDAFA